MDKSVVYVGLISIAIAYAVLAFFNLPAAINLFKIIFTEFFWLIIGAISGFTGLILAALAVNGGEEGVALMAIGFFASPVTAIISASSAGLVTFLGYSESRIVICSIVNVIILIATFLFGFLQVKR
eukprot:NODE_10477_length_513_cov_9.117949_g9829_i0.p1 GENE.NODE_10477_length_513_cov_9.117949_g9829_i0~~NODE_10477_length_513_cov_9.117949_g9829_i0.p1  ORF type:complete len:139 (-),score=6.32 NODE_10477_length_513_cov_9.117949_g9829_i0:95-472(-)